RHRRRDVACLALIANVALNPSPQFVVAVDGGELAWRLQWSFGLFLGVLDHVEPARIFAQLFADGENFLTEFFDAPLVDEEFDARGVAVLLFTVLAVDAAHRLRERKHL